MKVTMKKVIEATCQDDETKALFRAVIRQFGDWNTFYEYPNDYRNASASVSGFINYYDTHRFAKRNLLNIITVLHNFEDAIFGWFRFVAMLMVLFVRVVC